MRLDSKCATAVSLLIALAGASCSSEPQTFPTQPVPAALTDMQAATLAREYLTQNELPARGMIVGEERQANSWWFYYKTPFDVAARPSSLCYLLQVHDDGTVNHLR